MSDPTPPVDDAFAPSATHKLAVPAVAAPPPSTAVVPKPPACDEDALESVASRIGPSGELAGLRPRRTEPFPV